MDKIDKTVLDLLKAGRSYREIASELGVSTRRIAEVKKAWSNGESASINAFHDLESDSNPVGGGISHTNTPPGNQNQSLTLKKTTVMENNDYRNRYPDPQAANVEIRRAELQHEVELKRLEMQQRENEIRFEREKMQFEREKISTGDRKRQEEERNLEYRLSKLFESCIEEEWDYESALDYYNDMDDLIEDIKKFCYIYKCDPEDTFEVVTLKKIHSVFDEFTDDWHNQDRTQVLELDDDLREELEAFNENEVDSEE
jgi:hypothetical protein